MIRWECVDDNFFPFFQTVNVKILKFNVLSGKLLAMSMIEVKFIIVFGKSQTTFESIEDNF